MRWRSVYRPWPREYPGPWAGVWLESVGRRDCSRPSVNPKPNFHCAHLLTRGRVRFRSGAEVDERLSAGQMFAMWPGVPHELTPFPLQAGHGVRMLWIRLRGPLAHAFMESMGFTEAAPCIRASDPRRVGTLMRQLLRLAELDPLQADMTATALLHLMAPACGHRQAPRSNASSLATQVRAAMEREVAQGMNVEQFSRAFGVSRSALFLKFRREFAASPVEVLIETRIAHAKRLLEQTDLAVRQVASACGYTDPLYFTRQFRQRTGRPPAAYRARVRGSASCGDARRHR